MTLDNQKPPPQSGRMASGVAANTVLSIVTGFVGGTFALAGVMKLRRPISGAVALNSLGWASPIKSVDFVRVFACVEVVLAILLMAGQGRWRVAAAIAVALLSVSFYIIGGRLDAMHVPCGCLGDIDRQGSGRRLRGPLILFSFLLAVSSATGFNDAAKPVWLLTGVLVAAGTIIALGHNWTVAVESMQLTLERHTRQAVPVHNRRNILRLAATGAGAGLASVLGMSPARALVSSSTASLDDHLVTSDLSEGRLQTLLRQMEASPSFQELKSALALQGLFAHSDPPRGLLAAVVGSENALSNLGQVEMLTVPVRDGLGTERASLVWSVSEGRGVSHVNLPQARTILLATDGVVSRVEGEDYNALFSNFNPPPVFSNGASPSALAVNDCDRCLSEATFFCSILFQLVAVACAIPFNPFCVSAFISATAVCGALYIGCATRCRDAILGFFCDRTPFC